MYNKWKSYKKNCFNPCFVYYWVSNLYTYEKWTQYNGHTVTHANSPNDTKYMCPICTHEKLTQYFGHTVTQNDTKLITVKDFISHS